MWNGNKGLSGEIYWAVASSYLTRVWCLCGGKMGIAPIKHVLLLYVNQSLLYPTHSGPIHILIKINSRTVDVNQSRFGPQQAASLSFVLFSWNDCKWRMLNFDTISDVFAKRISCLFQCPLKPVFEIWHIWCRYQRYLPANRKVSRILAIVAH